MKKIIALNLKTYEQSLGENCLKLSRVARDVAHTHHFAQLIVAPPAPFLSQIASENKESNFWVFGQHADPAPLGQSTGSIPVEAVKEAGCKGTLLNHAEKKLPHEVVRETVSKASEIGLKTLVCADSLREAKALAKFSPWALAVEPPELIGSGISVSSARPEIVRDAVAEVKNINARIRVLVGAGITNAEDVRSAIHLGAEGVLLASAFVKAREPGRFLKELVDAVK